MLDDRALFSGEFVTVLLSSITLPLVSSLGLQLLFSQSLQTAGVSPLISRNFFLFSVLTYHGGPCDIPPIYLIPCYPELHGSNKSPLCGLLLNFFLSFNTGLTRTVAKNGKPLCFRPLRLYLPDRISCSVTQPTIA